MTDQPGSPLTREFHKMLRDPAILARVRTIVEEGEARGEISHDDAAEKLRIVEAVEREIAEGDSQPQT